MITNNNNNYIIYVYIYILHTYVHIIILYSFYYQDNVLIGGQKVDRIKLQAAKLQTDATKCALQLASCLFNLEELINGNPSGVTNSKDEVRKQTLEKLDRSI